MQIVKPKNYPNSKKTRLPNINFKIINTKTKTKTYTLNVKTYISPSKIEENKLPTNSNKSSCLTLMRDNSNQVWLHQKEYGMQIE